MSITNTQLAQQIQQLVSFWRNRDLEFQAWLSGTATGGPYSDGRYPLTDYLNETYLVRSPAALQAQVDGQTNSAQAFAAAASASAASASAARTAAEAARDLALTYRNESQAARDLALAYRNQAAGHRADADTFATNAASSASAAASSASTASTSATNAASSASAAATSATNAAASASAAAASAAAAATFNPALYATLAGAAFTGTVTVGGVNVRDAAILNSGTVSTARLGSGTANSTTFLRGDGAWAAPPGASWGSIAGTLSSQTDLNSALNARALLSGATFTGNVGVGAAPDGRFRVSLAGLADLRIGFGGTSQNYYEANVQFFRNAAGAERMVIRGDADVNTQLQTGLQITGTPTGGFVSANGLELGISGGSGYIQMFNRGTGVYTPLRLSANSYICEINANGHPPWRASAATFSGSRFVGAVTDNRNSLYLPGTLGKEWEWQFATLATYSLGGGGSFAGVLNVAPWADDSGDGSHQLAMSAGSGNGRLHYRYGTRSGGWQAWKSVCAIQGFTGGGNIVVQSGGSPSGGNDGDIFLIW